MLKCNLMPISLAAATALAGGAASAQMETPDPAFTLYTDAEEAVRDGDLTIALSLLESALYEDPNSIFARLFYASVLLRLDSLAEAQRQVDIVLGQEITDGQRREAEKLRDLIDQQEQGTLVVVSTSAGVKYSSNQTAAPDADTLDFFGFPVRNATEVPDDIVVTASADLEVFHDLGFQRSHALRGGFGVETESPIYERLTDQQLATSNIELELDFSPVTVSPGISGAAAVVAGDLALLQIAGSTELSLSLGEAVVASISPSIGYHEFFDGEGVSDGDRRSGLFYGASSQLRASLTDNLAVGLYGTVRRTEAEDFYANLALSYGAGISWRPVDFLSLVASGGVEHAFYDEPDAFVNPTVEREDLRLRLEFAPTFHVDEVLGMAGAHDAARFIEGLTLNPFIRHRRTDSNLSNYSFNDTEVGFNIGYSHVF